MLRIGGLQIEVLQVAENTVRTVRVRVLQPTGPATAGAPDAPSAGA
jgi:Mg2+/Co2+ transporter CorB